MTTLQYSETHTPPIPSSAIFKHDNYTSAQIPLFDVTPPFSFLESVLMVLTLAHVPTLTPHSDPGSVGIDSLITASTYSNG